MGTFTHRTRFEDEVKPFSTNLAYTDYRKAEYLYSWRSRRTKYDLDDSKTGYTVGIRPPIQQGSLTTILADRKRYIEEIGMAMVNPRSDTQFSQIQVCLAQDLGHPFTSVKWIAPTVGNVRMWDSTGKLMSSNQILATGQAYVPPELENKLPSLFPVSPLPSGLSAPSVLERNARLNPVFKDMAPTKEIAQIGETLISMLRGDIPHIFKKIEQAIREMSLKKATRTAGGEYLNNVFGWTPLIRDIENVIKILTTVDHLIYGTAYRRHRVIGWDSKFSRRDLTQVQTLSLYNPTGVGSSSAYAAGAGAELQEQMSYDIRLSARLVPIARPTIGANAFVDRAGDVLRELGLWYPALGWDLLPYSWLVDWFTSLGSSLNNAMVYGTSPGMVSIDYAWATSCTKVLSHLNFSNERRFAPNSSVFVQMTGHPSTISISKTRFQASPYGFGLDLSSLTGGQIAILVALGLAKRP